MCQLDQNPFVKLLGRVEDLRARVHGRRYQIVGRRVDGISRGSCPTAVSRLSPARSPSKRAGARSNGRGESIVSDGIVLRRRTAVTTRGVRTPEALWGRSGDLGCFAGPHWPALGQVGGNLNTRGKARVWSAEGCASQKWRAPLRGCDHRPGSVGRAVRWPRPSATPSRHRHGRRRT